MQFISIHRQKGKWLIGGKNMGLILESGNKLPDFYRQKYQVIAGLSVFDQKKI